MNVAADTVVSVALYLVAAAIGLLILFEVIKAAVYQGLARFLREAAREGAMRTGHEVPRHLDQVVAHVRRITRDAPAE